MGLNQMEKWLVGYIKWVGLIDVYIVYDQFDFYLVSFYVIGGLCKILGWWGLMILIDGDFGLVV